MCMVVGSWSGTSKVDVGLHTLEMVVGENIVVVENFDSDVVAAADGMNLDRVGVHKNYR